MEAAMKKLALLCILLLTACMLKPNDFPTPPPFNPPPKMTVIVELPVQTATPVVELRIKPILGNDKSNTATFFLITKTKFLAGDDQGIAESVKYPIKVRLNGSETVINTAADFVKNFKAIFNDKVSKALIESDENELLITAKGVRIGNGELWFNQFCSDAVCAKGEFLITQINN
jgi:hypothetical protein